MSIPSEFPTDGPGGDFPGGGGTLSVRITTTSPLPQGNQGAPYFTYLDAAFGYPPYAWFLVTGFLPGGLTLDSSGFIAGTPTTAGTFTFTIRVVDSIGGINNRIFTLVIDTATTPTILTTSLPPVMVGNSYSQTIATIGGTPPYVNHFISTGFLPTGLTLNSVSGEISGTPTVAGIYSFVITVEDSIGQIDDQSLSILIQGTNPSITTTSVPAGATGVSYNATIQATGGTTPYTQWQVISGSLPTGLLLAGTPTTASISGTPVASGSYTFTVQVTDTGGQTDTQLLNILIVDGNYPTISTTQLDFAPLNTAYSDTVFASGGSLPYIWSIASGDLPAGLTLDSSSGIISGTPTQPGSFIFTVKAQDTAGQFDTQLLSLVVGNFILPSITTDLLPNGVATRSYSTYVQATGGLLPYSWGIVGLLPPGLTINSITGQISGTPTSGGVYSFNVLVQDSSGDIDVQGFILSIGTPSLPIILTTSLEQGNLDVTYQQSLSAYGGVPGYTWTLHTGSLPPGLNISTTGLIYGTPTAIGAYNFIIQVKDNSNNTYLQSYTLVITSTGYSSNCCFCVFTNEIVEFNSNSSTGVLTATGGTILSNTKWQAPDIAGNYNLTMTADGINGSIQVINTVTVVKRLQLVDTPEVIDFLLPGDELTLKTNYPSEDVSWETINYDIPIVTKNGKLMINTSVADRCFGSLDATVRGKLSIDGICSTLESIVEVKVIVKPVYPTPDNCGPDILKWLRETKDFRVLVTEFEGGCDETHIRNKVPIVKWTINYDGLRNHLATDREILCPLHIEATRICGCTTPEEISVLPGCHPVLKSSNRLDDFWNLVYGQYKSFTLVDDDTGEVWYNVRFADTIATDHRHRRNNTARTVRLVWKPCCVTAPAGGTCARHGIFNYTPKKISRICAEEEICKPFIPSTPLITNIDNTCDAAFNVSWTESSSNNPIISYELLVDGVENYITSQFSLQTRSYEPDSSHKFKVRSLDSKGTYSEWSREVTAIATASFEIVMESGEPVFENGEQVIEFIGCDDLTGEAPGVPSGLIASQVDCETEVNLSWSAATGDIVTYELYVNGSIYNIGLVTDYTHSGLLGGVNYEYKVRSSNGIIASGWSNIENITVDDNLPIVTITSPIAGSEITGTIELIATVIDNNPINRVEWYYYDNTTSSYIFIGNSTVPISGEYSYFWDTSVVTDEATVIRAIAVNDCDHESIPAEIPLSMDDGTPVSFLIFDGDLITNSGDFLTDEE